MDRIYIPSNSEFAVASPILIDYTTHNNSTSNHNLFIQKTSAPPPFSFTHSAPTHIFTEDPFNYPFIHTTIYPSILFDHPPVIHLPIQAVYKKNTAILNNTDAH